MKKTRKKNPLFPNQSEKYVCNEMWCKSMETLFLDEEVKAAKNFGKLDKNHSLHKYAKEKN